LQNECWPAIRCSWFVQGNNEHACLWRGAGPRSCLAGYGRERVYVPQPLCEAHWAIGPWQTAELLDAAHALPFTFSERSLARRFVARANTLKQDEQPVDLSMRSAQPL